MHTTAERYRLGFSWLIGLIFISIILFSKSGYEGSLSYEILELSGYVLIVIATLGRIWATVYIGGRKDEELCQDGPYSIWRNPLYVFSFLGAVGIILSSGKLILLFIIMPFFIYNYYFVIKGEEARLLELFGNEYAEYCKKVKRIIPTFNNYWSRNNFEVYPKIFFRSMVHASLFMWLFILLEFLEYFKENTKLIPTLFYLPF
ncbi:MAG: isoprenylcysteine carboxylmethyltransferase family protein [Deltaproteobacteria bacterium]|nr:isoprenylcysteine carboxylmethyltransferase family protein [Deltaproteobacteria bacterium]